MKLHGSQTRKDFPSAAPWVWQTWNYMGSNLIGGGTGLERERLQGTQTLHYVYLSWSKVWRRKKLQGSQTKLNFFSVWKKVKLHGTQTHATLWWKITESSNSVTRSYGALEKGKIAWYSNISCMANQISPLWRRVKSYGSQINRAQYFCVHFYLKGTKKS